MELIDDEMLEAANCRGAEVKAAYPAVMAVRFDACTARIVLALDSGIGLSVSPHDVPGLELARPDDLDVSEISPSGLGVFFPKIDGDIYMPLLIERFMGSKRRIAAQEAGDSQPKSGLASDASADDEPA